MPAKRIFAIVKKLSGPNKGKTYKRYFKSEADRKAYLDRASKSGGLFRPKKHMTAKNIVNKKKASKAIRGAIIKNLTR